MSTTETTSPPFHLGAPAVGVSAKVNLPAKYHAARQALAECVRVDEVKTMRDKALAMEVYALQQKDADLIAASVYIRKRAERRIGELMAEERKAGDLKEGRPKKRVAGGPVFVDLAKRGIDKHLADRARKAAATPDAKYEAQTNAAIKIAVAAATDNKAVVTAARAERHETKRKAREVREKALATKLLALPKKQYGVILADPEWRFEFWSPKGLTNSSADNHYETSPLEEIKKRDVPSIAADDCVLFLWATVPMMPQALEVMTAWGFEYRSHCIWDKQTIGTGYWFRNQHELLLVGTPRDCNVPAPADGTQFPSVFVAPVGKHSEKPDKAYEIIEAYFPNLPKIELNARKARDGWDSWGLEAPQPQVATITPLRPTGRMKWLAIEKLEDDIDELPLDENGVPVQPAWWDDSADEWFELVEFKGCPPGTAAGLPDAPPPAT
jgi:N6-adenosine-specific RNA methylase IME4